MKEINRRLEKRLDFLPLLTFEEIGTGCDERIHEADAVLAGLTARRLYPVICFSLCWKDVRPSVKYEAVRKNRYEYDISFPYKFFEVSKSGY